MFWKLLRLLSLMLWALSFFARRGLPQSLPASSQSAAQLPAKRPAAKPRKAVEQKPRVDLVTGITAPRVDPTPTPPKIEPVDPIIAEAIRAAQEWRSMPMLPKVTPGGMLQYVYGRGFPVIVCAPQHVCWLELKRGEHIQPNPETGEPLVSIGDTERWLFQPMETKDNDVVPPGVIFKPLRPDLSTNGIIVTDQHRYFFGLTSTKGDYVNGIAFAYPDEDLAERKAMKLAAEKEKKDLEPVVIIPSAAKYSVKAKKEVEAHLRPVRVFDDNQKTYLQMPDAMTNREMPVLLVLDESGKPEISNLRAQNNMLIVDRLFHKADLKIGNGKKSHVVHITREGV